jgi:hypothetical protein
LLHADSTSNAAATTGSHSRFMEISFPGVRGRTRRALWDAGRPLNSLAGDGEAA